METDIQRNKNLSIIFLELGCQYYAVARYSAPFFYSPVGPTMFHHAVEMFLKGYLVKAHSLETLKKQYGHNLKKLWREYKSITGDTSLSRYDKSIRELDKVESLRYPDNMIDGAFVVSISIKEPTALPLPDQNNSELLRHLGLHNLKQYLINVSDLDEITLSIFAACEVNPKASFNKTPTVFLNALPAAFRIDNE